MNRVLSVVLTVVILALLIGGGYWAYTMLINKTDMSAGNTDPAPVSQDSSRVKAPDFTVVNADGNMIKLSDMLGKPVVLNFWASWCPPCRSEMPDFDKVYQDLGDSVQFMMVDVTDGNQETKESGETYVMSQGYTFPVFYDTNQDAAGKYGIRAIPTTFFIDSEGYIINSVESAMSEDTLRTNIGVILASGQAQTAVYHQIKPEDAKAIMDSTQPYILVDVRTDSEYKAGHIEGAILIPDTEITDKAASELPDKNALIMVYCRSGVRSAGASKALVGMGYTKVYDLGGIINWPYGTVTD